MTPSDTKEAEKESRPYNEVAISADGHIMAISEHKNHKTEWIQVHSKKLRKAVKEAFGFADWQVEL